MSTPSVVSIPGSDKKPLTAGFQLQTRIRLIIQQVLAATVRKLSLFGEKIERFQEYFITFKERFESGERERNHIQGEITKIGDTQLNIRRQLSLKEVKNNEDRERSTLLLNESKQEIKDLQKIAKTLVRQNENINAELSKTKSKFLQYSNTITTVKQEVSGKITKYLQETAETHTQMKLVSEGIKLQNFNMNLQIDKQKEKYDQIILKYEEDVLFREEMKERIDALTAENGKRVSEIGRLNTKIDDVQLTILSKIKSNDLKFQQKMKDLDKNNNKLTSVFKKIDNFNDLLQGVKQQIEQNAMSATKAVEQMLRRGKDYTDDQVSRIFKENQRIEKKMDKNNQGNEDKLEKLQDFILQKLDFVKMEIESQLSGKTAKILQQKSKTEQHLNSSTIDDISAKMAKMQIETAKHISKTQNHLKEQIVQVKKQVEKVKDEVDAKIQDTISSGNFSGPPREGGSISSQRMGHLSGQLNLLKQGVREIQGKVETLQGAREQLEHTCAVLRKNVEDKFIDSQQKLMTKVQKVMFLVTKMRGDSIIRNEFNDKQIRQLKRSHHEVKNRLENTWKLLPGIGECLNTVMALIFDAEFQHSKIIQDNLPMLAKDIERFNTCSEGVIYEFKQKKKSGMICYRHNQLKKTDLVRATFNGYIQLWQQLFQSELKNKQHLLPKGFYKRLVQKNLKGGIKSDKEGSNGGLSQFTSVQQMKSSGGISDMMMGRSQTNDPMNSSFHIRKKRTAPGKDRQKLEEMMSHEIRQ